MHLHHFKRCCRAATVLLIIVLMMLAASGCAGGIGQPDYSVEAYDISVLVQPDGNAVVTEKILYSFNEDKRSLDLYLNRLRNARLADVSISLSERNPDSSSLGLPLEDNGIIYQNIQQGDPKASTQNPMTWLQTEQEDSIRVRLNAIFEAGNSHQLIVSYNLNELVRRNDELAYIRQQLCVLPEDVPLKNINVSYTLPYQPENADSWLRMVGHNSTDTGIVDVDKWNINWQNISSEDFPESTLIMPPEYFGQISISQALGTKAELIEDAQQRISQIDRQQFWRDSVEALVFFLLVLSLIFMILIYFIFDREGMASFRERYYIPDSIELPPAVMSLLMRRNKPAGLVLSTLIDLVRREELRLEGHVFTWLNPVRNDYVGFKAYEIFLLQWIFDKVSNGGNTISAEQIRDYAKNRKTSEEFRGYYEQFVELLGEELISYGLFDEGKSFYGRLIGQSLAASYVVMAVLSSVFLMSVVGMLLLVPAIVFYLYALSLRHLTSYGNEQYARCNAFGRYLNRFYEINQENNEIRLPDCTEVTLYLPYSIAMNRTKSFMRQLLTLAKASSAECGDEILVTYQNQSMNSVTRRKESENQPGSEAVKTAAAVEQIRLLGRDLVSLESIMAAGFYMSSSFHLVDDH